MDGMDVSGGYYVSIGKGLIIRRNRQWPDYVQDNNAHESMVELLHLYDNKHIDKQFMRIEMWPKDDLLSTQRKDWEFKTIGSIPNWFEEQYSYWEDRCHDTMRTIIIPEWNETKTMRGSLYLMGTKIRTLGKLEVVKGSLYLAASPIVSLGKLRQVTGHLELYGTKIKSVPVSLKVGSIHI